jgi:hypothetical protein
MQSIHDAAKDFGATCLSEVSAPLPRTLRRTLSTRDSDQSTIHDTDSISEGGK